MLKFFQNIKKSISFIRNAYNQSLWILKLLPEATTPHCQECFQIQDNSYSLNCSPIFLEVIIFFSFVIKYPGWNMAYKQIFFFCREKAKCPRLNNLCSIEVQPRYQIQRPTGKWPLQSAMWMYFTLDYVSIIFSNRRCITFFSTFFIPPLSLNHGNFIIIVLLGGWYPCGPCVWFTRADVYYATRQYCDMTQQSSLYFHFLLSAILNGNANGKK